MTPESEKLLHRYADESSSDLTAWRAAYDVLNEWLHKRGRTANEEAKLGFLECCATVAEREGHLRPMAGVTADMLEEHGFEGDESV